MDIDGFMVMPRLVGILLRPQFSGIRLDILKTLCYLDESVSIFHNRWANRTELTTQFTFSHLRTSLVIQ